MEADLDETRILLGSKAASTDINAYADGLKCAAKFDLAAKKGALPAHEAQASAKQVLMVSAIGYETGISPTASEDQRETELNDYRQQTYRNYLLVRASIDPEKTGEELLTEARECYTDFGFEVEQPAETENGSDEAAPASGQQ